MENEKENENRKAIVIGINKYQSDPTISELEGAENDAEELRDILVEYGNFEISNNHYLVGPEATRRNILTAVSDIFRKDDKYDLVTFYFSGHGIPDETTKDGYIAPYDYHPNDPIISGINMAELKKAIYNTKNISNTIIILDCCYAGIVTTDTSKSKKEPMALTMMRPQEARKEKNRLYLVSFLIF